MIMLSDLALDAFIRSWRRARLARDVGHLGYPTVNILHPKHGVGDDDEPEDDDAEVVQRYVESMPTEIRVVFEARYLGIIRGDFCRNKPHQWRCLVLGLDKSTYWSRVDSGRNMLKKGLTDYLKSVESTAGNCAQNL